VTLGNSIIKMGREKKIIKAAVVKSQNKRLPVV